MTTLYLSDNWKDIPGYKGLYQINEIGQVRTLEGKVTFTKHHGKRVWKTRLLKQKSKNNDYIRFDLWKNGKPKTFLAHRLVAITFIENPKGFPLVNHIDGNTRNNHISNLEWCDYIKNNNHAFDNKLNKIAIETRLLNIKDNKMITFRSRSKANQFLGRSSNYLNDRIKRGITIVECTKGEKYQLIGV